MDGPCRYRFVQRPGLLTELAGSRAMLSVFNEVQLLGRVMLASTLEVRVFALIIFILRPRIAENDISSAFSV